ncbi:unnamed protein product, partial [Amoebophrya sp. A25]
PPLNVEEQAANRRKRRRREEREKFKKNTNFPLFQGYTGEQLRQMHPTDLEREFRLSSKQKLEERKASRLEHIQQDGRDKGLNLELDADSRYEQRSSPTSARSRRSGSRGRGSSRFSSRNSDSSFGGGFTTDATSAASGRENRSRSLSRHRENRRREIRVRRWRDECERRRLLDDTMGALTKRDIKYDFRRRVKKVRRRVMREYIQNRNQQEAQGKMPFHPAARSGGPEAALGAADSLLARGGASNGLHAADAAIEESEFLESIVTSFPYGYREEIFKWLGRLFKSIVAVDAKTKISGGTISPSQLPGGSNPSEDGAVPAASAPFSSGAAAAVGDAQPPPAKAKASPKVLAIKEEQKRLFRLIDDYFLPHTEEDDEMTVDKSSDIVIPQAPVADLNRCFSDEKKRKAFARMLHTHRMVMQPPRWKGFGLPIYGSPEFYQLAPPPDPPQETLVSLQDAREFEKRGFAVMRERMGKGATRYDEQKVNQAYGRDVQTRSKDDIAYWARRGINSAAWHAEGNLLSSVHYIDFLWTVLERQSMTLRQKKEFIRLIAAQRAEAREARERAPLVRDEDLLPTRDMLLVQPKTKMKEAAAGDGQEGGVETTRQAID